MCSLFLHVHLLTMQGPKSHYQNKVSLLVSPSVTSYGKLVTCAGLISLTSGHFISHIWHSLADDLAKSVASTLFGFQPDYANVVLYGI